MTVNVGTRDRLVRLVIGAVLLAAPFVTNFALFTNTTVTTISVVVGIVLLATSAIRFCPLYSIFGLRTCQA
ncbi:Protein of unknown function (DUF2892) [Yoonia maritima]|uniref:Inner membrane protein YgaP-like transmembrane domain-containing protein n=1 Tax=Yoonia maritima TaxID=1435347 RepID=A0A2T0VWQ0_9RHOB|nr:DUF2892 domain-containing protein [Yoonia maritima]PRY76313.1 Protein of unknown function (DUF2892) [Yoonia maritima]